MPFWPPDSLSAIIGAPVTGGVPGSVLFVGATGLLDQDPTFFSYTKATHTLITGPLDVRGAILLNALTAGITQGGGVTGGFSWRGSVRLGGEVVASPVEVTYRSGGAVAADLARWYSDNEATLALTITGAGVVRPAVQLDLSTIPAANAEIKVAATSDVPVTTWTAGVPSTDPAGFVKLDVAGAPRYIPFWT
jgi:hypothetical protein